jgi:hypothetical protein
MEHEDVAGGGGRGARPSGVAIPRITSFTVVGLSLAVIVTSAPLSASRSVICPKTRRTDAAVTGHIRAGSYEVTKLRSYERLQDDTRGRPTDRL